MTSFEEKLILLVKEKPCLYVKSSKEYKNAYKKDAVWASIAEQLNKPGKYDYVLNLRKALFT